MNNLLKLIALIVLVSCSSLGTSVKHNSLPSNLKIDTLFIFKPNLKNVNFYKESTQEFYERELSNVFKKYNITVVSLSDSTSNFNDIRFDAFENKVTKSESNYVLAAEIVRLTAMDVTRDFNVNYKLLKAMDGSLQYHSEFSTTFGKTYVMFPGVTRFPTEEQLLTDAIRDGLIEFEKSAFMKK